jgi:hypothetical protein
MKVQVSQILQEAGTTQSVLFLVPVGKEGEALYESIRSIKENLSKASLENPYDLVLATDINDIDTIDAMKTLSAENHCICYKLAKRVGKGGTVKNILGLYSGRICVIIDSDLAISTKTLRKAIESVTRSQADIVVGERISRSHGPMRRIMSIGYNTIVRILFRTGLQDHQAGFKVIGNSTADKIIEYIRTDGFAFDTEVIVWAKLLGMRVKKMPIVLEERRDPAQSTILPWRALLTMMADLILLRLLTLGRKRDALKRKPVGKIYDMDGKQICDEFMTCISSGHKNLLSVLRAIYLAVAFRH